MSDLDLIDYDETFSILNDVNINYDGIGDKETLNYLPLDFFDPHDDFVLINSNDSDHLNSVSNFIIESNLTDFLTNDKIVLLSNNPYSDLLPVPEPLVEEPAFTFPAITNEILPDIVEKPEVIENKGFEKVCQCCDQTFTNEEFYDRHVKSAEESYQCQICDKYFAQQSNLWKHVRTHGNERPFKCAGCDKSFSQRSNMIKHQLGHLGDRPFSCTQCSRTFVQEANLNKHLLVHSGEKPFACEVCDKRFSQRSNLVKHKYTHDEKRPMFECDICGQSFTQKCNLKKHLGGHSKSGTYFCKFCNKGFSQQTNVDKHLIKCKVRQLYEN